MRQAIKISILIMLCAVPVFVPAQPQGGGITVAPPIIRNTPLGPQGQTPQTPQATPAEVPQRSDIGEMGVTDPLLKEGYAALAKWDLVGAEKVADKLRAEGRAGKSDSQMFLFRLAFFHGNYAEAAGIIEKMNLSPEAQAHVESFDRVRNLAKVMQGALIFQSDHFIVHVTPGPDEILAKDALRTLEQAYAVLTEDLQVKPTGKVTVEIFPTFRAFNWATGLSEKDVETSGTVAVCKYSRLMITTPRALLNGYVWRDTLSHEFVHYLVFLRSGYSAPIWMHEGIAKFEEERWRSPEGGYLAPLSQSILASALDKNDLVTFDQMEPTFAKLPSPMHGALAFAECNEAIKYLVQLGGFQLVIRLIDKLNKNPDYKKAIREEVGVPYEKWKSNWIAWMKKQPLQRMKGFEWVSLKIKSGKEVDETEAIFGHKKESLIYRYVRLGDLLSEQELYQAALIEYTKALNAEPDSTTLLNKTAHMYMMVGDMNSAEPLLKKVDLMSPMSFPSVYKRLGIIYATRKDWATARKYLETSADINPFDPELQGLLQKVYTELGAKDLAMETSQKIDILNRPRGPE